MKCGWRWACCSFFCSSLLLVCSLSFGTTTADAHLVGCYHHRQSHKTERRCAARNYYHAAGTLRFLRIHFKRELSAGKQPFVTIWKNHQWLRRDSRIRIQKLDRTLPLVGDWLTAVRIAQRPFPGSEWWLVACSSSEGGHGGWIRGRTNSSVGGWMQYTEGTFWHDFNRARADATRRGWLVPAAAASWYSPLGQALAAGWAYFHDRPVGKWTGSRC